MNEEEKIQIIDKFLMLLDQHHIGTVPGLINGHPNKPIDEITDKKYRVIENELERLKLVYFIEGKDNSTIDFFARYRLAPDGLELLLNQRSCKVIYEKEKKARRKEDIDFKLKLFQSRTYWMLFIISLIGGILGAVSFVLRLIEKS